MVGHHCPACMTTLEMVITCTVTFTLECALDVWDPPVKNSWSNHMSQFCYLFLAAREVGEPCKQLCITPKMLSKPRCRCEQLGIQPWWHPQLYHIRLTESWCQFNFKLLWCYNNLWSNTLIWCKLSLHKDLVEDLGYWAHIIFIMIVQLEWPH